MTPRDKFMERAERLVARLVDGPLHPDVARDREFALEALRDMMRRVREDSLPPRSERYPHLAHLAVGQWPLGDEVANEVGEVEALYRKI